MIRAALMAAATTLALVSAAHAEPSTDLARRHIDAVAAGDVDQIIAQYGEQSALSWIGGPLDGSYRGPAQLADVWGKFAKQAPLKATIRAIAENANPAGTTVTADVVFEGKATIKVHYVLLYRGDRLVGEIWQIDPKLAS